MKKLYTEFDLTEKQWEVFKSMITPTLLEALNEGWVEFDDIFKDLSSDQRNYIYNID